MRLTVGDAKILSARVSCSLRVRAEFLKFHPNSHHQSSIATRMSKSVRDIDEYPAPAEHERSLVVQRDWTEQEEKKAKRK